MFNFIIQICCCCKVIFVVWQNLPSSEEVSSADRTASVQWAPDSGGVVDLPSSGTVQRLGETAGDDRVHARHGHGRQGRIPHQTRLWRWT